MKFTKATRIYRGVTYNITIHNYGNPYKMIVDGKEIDGSIIPYNKNDKDVNVEIFM